MDTYRLECLSACADGVGYAKTQPDSQAMWQNCVRGDWMLWLLARSHQPLTKAQAVAIAQDCAKAAQGYAAADAHAAAAAADAAGYAEDAAAYAADAADAAAAAGAAAEAAGCAYADERKRQADLIRVIVPNCPEF